MSLYSGFSWECYSQLSSDQVHLVILDNINLFAPDWTGYLHLLLTVPLPVFTFSIKGLLNSTIIWKRNIKSNQGKVVDMDHSLRNTCLIWLPSPRIQPTDASSWLSGPLQVLLKSFPPTTIPAPRDTLLKKTKHQIILKTHAGFTSSIR